MPKTIFDQIPKDDREPILGMLNRIVDHEDEFVNDVHYDQSGEGHDYFVQSRDHRRTSVSHHFRHFKSLYPTLMQLGLITPHSHTSFEFRQATLDAYQGRNFVPNSEIQQRIGQVLWDHWRRNRSYAHDERIDIDALVQELGVDRDRIVDSLDVLHRAGIVAEGRYSHQGTLDQGYAYLADRGFEWANAGFSDIATWGGRQINVGVDLRVQLQLTIQTTINGLQRADMPEDFKEQLVEALRDLEREPTPEKIQKVMAFGADTTQFGAATLVALPYILNFLQQSGEIINRLFPFHRLT
jgi:hypothetical protein